MTEFIDEVKDYIKNKKRELKDRNSIIKSDSLVEGQFRFYEFHGLLVVGDFFMVDQDVEEIYNKTYSPFLCHVEHLLVDYEFKIFKRFIKIVKKTFSSFNYEIFLNTVINQLIQQQEKYRDRDCPFANFMVCVQRGLMRKINLYRIYNDI